MAQPFTLKLGNLDISDYLRVAPGEGFDPMDNDGFLSPAFGDSPLAEGEPLLNVDPTNRTMTIPLHLKGADKDTLHAVARSINNEIATNPALRLEWKDKGATNSTFYDVTFARFDPDYNFRRSERNYASGILRVWTLPYGHTNTSIVGAVNGGTGAAVVAYTGATTFAAATTPGGDAPGLIDATLQCATYNNPGGRVALLSAIPRPSMTVYFPAASLQLFAPIGSSPVGASGAAGSQYVGLIREVASQIAADPQHITGATGAAGFAFALPIPSMYLGRRLRIMAVAAVTERSGVALRGYGPDGRPFGATVIGTCSDLLPNGRQIVDFGVLAVPSVMLGTNPLVSFDYGTLAFSATSSHGLGASGYPYSVGFINGYASAAAMDWRLKIDGVLVLPEDSVCFVRDNSRVPMSQDTFHVASTIPLSGRYDNLGNQWITASALDNRYGLSITGGQQGIRFSPSGAASQVAVVNCQPARDISMIALCDHLNNAAFYDEMGVALFSAASTIAPNLQAVFGRASAISPADPQGYVALRVGATLIASMKANPSGFEARYAHVRVDQRGAVATAVFRCFSAQANAWVPTTIILSGSHADFGGAHYPGIALGAPASVGNVFSIRDFTAHTTPPGVSTASQIGATNPLYRFSGINGEAVTREDSYNVDLSANHFGRVPQHTPSQTSAWLGLVINAEGGPANGPLSMTVNVRERFQYAR